MNSKHSSSSLDNSFESICIGSSDQSKSEIDIFQILLKNYKLLALGLLGGFLLGVLGYMRLGAEYQASSKVLVSKKATVPIKDGSTRTFGERGEHIALIMSPMIVEKAVKKHKLNELPSFKNSKDPADDILDTLQVKRSAGRDQSFLNVLDITYRNSKPKDASAVVTAVIDAYRDYLAESQKENSMEIVKLISEANTDLLKQLEAKQQEYLKFRDAAPLHWKHLPGSNKGSVESSNIHEQRVTAIETERRMNLLRRAEINSKLKSLKEAIDNGQSRDSLELLARRFLSVDSRSGSITPSLSGSPGGRSLDSQLLPLLIREQTLLRDFGPEHPEVQTVRKSIETIQSFYQQRRVHLPGRDDETAGENHLQKKQRVSQPIDVVAVYMLALKQQLNELEHRGEELETLLEDEISKAKVFARYQARDQVFQEEVSRIKSLWEVVVGRLNELKLVKNGAGYSMKQISPVREQLSMKRIIKLVGAGTFFGLAVAMGIAYLRFLQDTTLKSLDEIRQYVELPILGGVPQFTKNGILKEAENGFPALDPALCYHHRPNSAEAEAYRLVRTSLLVSTGSTRERVIQVSSPEPGDGKTTVISNLAIAMAQSGKKVLLLDADMRRPTVHQLFQASCDVGMSDVLAGELELMNAIQTSAVPGLSLLTAGETPSNPAELLATERFSRMVEEAKNEFDYVLIDTPPLLAVSDPCIAAPAADGLLLVVRIAKNKRVAVKRADELLETHGIHTLGVVANGMNADSDDEYGGKYAGYYITEEQPSSEPVASVTSV